MKIKTRARRTAYRRGPTNGGEWKPFGWYNNRPSVLREIQVQGIGVIERVSGTTSASIGRLT